MFDSWKKYYLSNCQCSNYTNKHSCCRQIFDLFNCYIFSEETKSAIFSIAELNISKANTNPIAKMIAIHSKTEILKAIDAIITLTVAKR
jgi:hypothetical protein